MFKKFWKFIKYQFKADQIGPDFSVYGIDMTLDEAQVERDKAIREREALSLQRTIANKNLRATHRSMMIAFFGVLVALLIGIAGIILNLRQKPVTIQVVSPESLQVKK